MNEITDRDRKLDDSPSPKVYDGDAEEFSPDFVEESKLPHLSPNDTHNFNFSLEELHDSLDSGNIAFSQELAEARIQVGDVSDISIHSDDTSGNPHDIPASEIRLSYPTLNEAPCDEERGAASSSKLCGYNDSRNFHVFSDDRYTKNIWDDIIEEVNINFDEPFTDIELEQSNLSHQQGGLEEWIDDDLFCNVSVKIDIDDVNDIL